MTQAAQVEKEQGARRPEGLRWRQPAFFLTAAFVTGVAVSRAWSLPAGATLAALACVVAAGLAAVARFARVSLLLAIAAAGILGAYTASLAPLKPAECAGRFLAAGGPLEGGGICRFRGIVLERTVDGRGREGGLSRYVVQLEALQPGSAWMNARGEAWLDAPERDLPYGACVEGMARAWLPPRAGLASEFDYRAYLERSGIEVLLRAQHEGLVRTTAPARGRWMGRFFERTRRAALARFEERELAGRGVLPAITIGERAAMSRDSEEAFVRSGTMHLIAISGLHLAIVGGFFWWMLRAAGVGMRKAAVATLVLAAAYAVLAGARPSVVRSALMVAMFCVATGIDRRAHALSVVSAAAAAMLIWNPLTLYDPGFQMSVVAILGVFYIGQPLARAAKGLVGDGEWAGAGVLRGAAEAAAFSIGASLAVAPIGLYHFRVVSLIAPLANLILIPISWALVVSGLLFAGVAAISGTLASPLALAASGAEDALILTARLFAAVPGAYAYFPSPPLWAIGVYYAALALVVTLAAAGRRIFPLVATALVAVNAIAAARVIMPPTAPPRAGIVHGTSGEAVVLLDGRGAATVLLGGRCEEYFATATLGPWLLEEGVRRIDVIIESAAADARVRDALAARFDVGRVLRQKRFKDAASEVASNTGAAIDADETGGEPVYTVALTLPAGAVPAPARTTGGFYVTQVGPGDRVDVARKWRFAFHAAPPQDFLKPTRLYLPGLIVEAQTPGGQVVTLLDMSAGCVAAAGRFAAGGADLAIIASSRDSQSLLEAYVASIGARRTISAPQNAENSSAVLAVVDDGRRSVK